MNHKWNNDKCVTCGATREKYWDGKFSYYTYARDGFSSRHIDCVDWEDGSLDTEIMGYTNSFFEEHNI